MSFCFKSIVFVVKLQECESYTGTGSEECLFYTYYGNNDQCFLYNTCTERACDDDDLCVTGTPNCDDDVGAGDDCADQDVECTGDLESVESATDLDECRQVSYIQDYAAERYN